MTEAEIEAKIPILKTELGAGWYIDYKHGVIQIRYGLSHALSKLVVMLDLKHDKTIIGKNNSELDKPVMDIFRRLKTLGIPRPESVIQEQ